VNLSRFREPVAWASAADLEVAPRVSAQWRALDSGVREQVAALFDRSCAVVGRAFAVRGRVPELFARDLACGGGGFRAAFPFLVRRVVRIAASPDSVSVRVVCRGQHVGTFFELLTPTRRWVRFHVDHRLAVIGDHVVEHCVALDLRALVVQLANSGAPGGART
jgi:hypothetical protein